MLCLFLNSEFSQALCPKNGGFEGFFNIDNQDTIYKNLITIASDGMPLTSFYHFYPIAAKDNVLLCKPNKTYR